jgi:hypothetical protein
MAIAGSAAQSFDMCIKDGKVIVGRYAHRQGVETDVDRGVVRLLAGETIFMHAYGMKVQDVRLAVEEILKEGDK